MVTDSAPANPGEQADENSIPVNNEQARDDAINADETKDSSGTVALDTKNALTQVPDNQLPQVNSRTKFISVIYPE